MADLQSGLFGEMCKGLLCFAKERDAGGTSWWRCVAWLAIVGQGWTG